MVTLGSVSNVGRKARPRIRDLSDSPIVVAYDPGETTGWSVMKVHPEALVDDNVKILSNVEFWTHGQIDCGARRGLPLVRDIFDGQGRLEYNDLAVNSEGENEGAEDMLQLFDNFPGACALLEDFVIRQFNKSRAFLAPVRVTEKFDFGLHMRGYQSFRQQPSEAKSTATDERLKSWGLYERAGGMNHARDADRHAITWLRKCSTKKGLREACWPHLYGKMQVEVPGRTGVYRTVVGPYFVPPGMTWVQVVERQEESDREAAAEQAQEARLAGVTEAATA